MRLVVLSVIALGLLLLTLGNSLSVAITQNALALCWSRQHSGKTAHICEDRIVTLESYSGRSVSARSAVARYAALSGDNQRVIKMLEGIDLKDRVLATTLFEAYLSVGDICRAVVVADALPLPVARLLSLAQESFRRGEFDNTRCWLTVIDRQVSSATWIERRDIGILHWLLNKDRNTSIKYLESVHQEEPNAVIPTLFLALIYVDSSPEDAIELLSQVKNQNSSSLIVYRDLVNMYGQSTSQEAKENAEQFREEVIELLQIYLHQYPNDQTALYVVKQLQNK